MHCAKRSQQLFLVGLADDIDQRDPVLDAELDEHLAEIRCRGRVHEGRMAFAAHGFQHSERGHRIDEGRRPVLRRCAVGQDKTRGSIDRSVLRVHCRRRRSPLSCRAGPGPLGMTRRRRRCPLPRCLPEAVCRPVPKALPVHRLSGCGDDGVFRRARHRRGGHVGAGDENAQV